MLNNIFSVLNRSCGNNFYIKLHIRIIKFMCIYMDTLHTSALDVFCVNSSLNEFSCHLYVR